MEQIENYLHEVCMVGHGPMRCRYLIIGPNGFSCAKADMLLKMSVDSTFHLTVHVAQGDNCEGIKDSSILNKIT